MRNINAHDQRCLSPNVGMARKTRDGRGICKALGHSFDVYKSSPGRKGTGA